MTSDLDTLARLVRRHADGVQLPTHIVRDGLAVPLASWLSGLSTDRSLAPTHVAALIGHPCEQPTVGEIAMTLSARLAERHS